MLSSTCINCIVKYYLKPYRCNKLTRCILLRRFANKKSCHGILVQSCITTELYSHISTMPFTYAKVAHTTKGWKFIARDGERVDHSSETSYKCEEGNEAISHVDIISKLQNCSSVTSQIETFSFLLSITPEDLQRRKAFCQSFDEALKIYFPQVKINLFGSSVNGLGFKGCDTDICLQTKFHNEDVIMLKEVPTLKSVLDGTVTKDTISCMNPLFTLRFVRRILRQHCPDIKEPILLVKARCPILRFYNSKYDLFCDFSCENKASLMNTKLLQLVCNLDSRFAPLAKVIRYWGKYGGFVGDIDMFNSYSFALLVVHFLQVTNPPVLPSVNEMLNKSEYLQHGCVDDMNMLLEDLHKFLPSKNDMTLEELLKKFYFFYLNFDFSRIIQSSTSTSIPVASFIHKMDGSDIFEPGSVNVQDPFRPSFNATSGASFKSCKRFLHGLVHACKYYQDEFECVPRTKLWGICSIFHSPLSETKIHENWRQTNFQTIEIPFRPNAAEKLKMIFEYGLLFHCKEYIINHNLDKETNTKSVMGLHCVAYNNTWQGRDWAYQELQDNKNSSSLELEHLISKKLLSKAENKRQILCDFQCECREIRKNNEPALMLVLNFKESKFPPVVAIFLKEFLPCIFRQM